MKKLLIDGTTLSQKIDGLTRYALSIIEQLDRARFEIALLVRPEDEEWLKQTTGLNTVPAAIAPIGPVRDLQFCAWLRAHQAEYDIFFEPSNQYPAGLRLPAIFVIHDVIYEEFPEQLGRLSGLKRAYLHHVVRRGLKQACKAICVSHYTKEDTIRYHGDFAVEKMIEIGEGWEHLTKSQQESYQGKDKYLFYLGSSRGHKNVTNLLRAIEKVADLMREHGYRLIITGRDDLYRAEDRVLMSSMADIVQTTGWISDEEMERYFRGAEALVFPSLSEGFGIPLLEAFYYGVPVLCSRQASLPEVAQEAASYFDPKDKDDIARAIGELIMGRTDQHALVEQGKQRLKAYSWQKTAREIEDELDKVQ